MIVYELMPHVRKRESNGTYLMYMNDATVAEPIEDEL